jgi:hypothetical protein
MENRICEDIIEPESYSVNNAAFTIADGVISWDPYYFDRSQSIRLTIAGQITGQPARVV